MYECFNCDITFDNPVAIRNELVCPRCYSSDISTSTDSKEEVIYNFLYWNCRGKKNLIKNKDLREIFNVGSDKSLRKIIQNIREDKEYECVIGSVSGKSGGFYIVETKEELEETINNIKHRANQMLRMTHVLEWKGKKYGI